MPKLKVFTLNKGNIPIQEELLNKYSNVEEIFENESINHKKVIIKNIEILNNINVNDLNITKLEKLVVKIFWQNHNTNKFWNDNNIITVTNRGIFESVQKIYHVRLQRDLMLEHLKIFSYLGKIIENAKLVNQVPERKGRIKYKCWNYYLDGIIIDNNEYLIEFEVISMDNGENHYHLQRLKFVKSHKKQACGVGTLIHKY